MGAHADLRIAGAVAAPDPVLAGQILQYTVVVENRGGDDANQVVLTADLPAGASFLGSGGAGWSCTVSAGGPAAGPRCGLAALAAGAAASLSLFVQAPAAGGPITASFAVAASRPTRCPRTTWRRRATVVVASSANLTIFEFAGALAVPGERLAYTLAARNLGPHPVLGATVTDHFPAGLHGVTWTCVASPGSSCTAAGSGDIVDTVQLAVGGLLIYQADTWVDLAVHGPIANTASIAGPAADPAPADNSSSVLTPFFDPQPLFRDGFESGDLSGWWEGGPLAVPLADEFPAEKGAFRGGCDPAAIWQLARGERWSALLEPAGREFPAVLVRLQRAGALLYLTAQPAAASPDSPVARLELTAAPRRLELECQASAGRGHRGGARCVLWVNGGELSLALGPAD